MMSRSWWTALPSSRSPRYARDQAEAESLRKMFLVMAEDIRVCSDQLGDRLHNMRTLSALKPVKQVKIARETLEIFAPLGNRRGIYRYSPRARRPFAQIPRIGKICRDRRISCRTTRMTATPTSGKPSRCCVKNWRKEGVTAEISGRPKHIYSIFNKALANSATFRTFTTFAPFAV